jgi:hypothetical protein
MSSSSFHERHVSVAGNDCTLQVTNHNAPLPTAKNFCGNWIPPRRVLNDTNTTETVDMLSDVHAGYIPSIWTVSSAHTVLFQLPVTSALMTAVILIIVYLFSFPVPFCFQLSLTHLVRNLSVAGSKIIAVIVTETHLNGCNSKTHVPILILWWLQFLFLLSGALKMTAVCCIAPVVRE